MGIAEPNEITSKHLFLLATSYKAELANIYTAEELINTILENICGLATTDDGSLFHLIAHTLGEAISS